MAPPGVPMDPVIVEKEVPKTVQVRCEDKRDPFPGLPTDEELSGVDEADPLAVVILSRIYRGALKIARARLKADDDQIKACVGP